MTNKEAKAWLQLAARVQQEFGCAVMFICDEEGCDQLTKARKPKAGEPTDDTDRRQKKFAADTDGAMNTSIESE